MQLWYCKQLVLQYFRVPRVSLKIFRHFIRHINPAKLTILRQ
jgi:hypothetical protein